MEHMNFDKHTEYTEYAEPIESPIEYEVRLEILQKFYLMMGDLVRETNLSEAQIYAEIKGLM